jgi:hypothetical protein
MLRHLLSVASAALLVSAGPAHALFHFAHIAEINANGGGNSGEQYVEIVMEIGGQTVTTNSVLGRFDCSGTYLGDLLIVPGDVTSGGAGRRWIMATTPSVGGVTADFTFPTAGIPLDCGMVCWGAPGLAPPANTNWDRTNLNENWVDCVAYGPCTGPTKSGSGGPTALTPGDGTYSLERVDDTTFAAACPSPQNNANDVGGYGECSAPTTTTTVVSGTTTTSTTPGPPGTPILLPGKKLDLKLNGGKPDKNKLFVGSQKDAALTLGRGAGSPDDPTLNGGSLVVSSGSPGGSFTDTYPLDAAGRSAKEKKGTVTGYTFKGDGPITSIKVKNGKTLELKGKGAGLGHDLDQDPDPVSVVLRLGEQPYCLEFGGTPKFKEGKSYSAKKAPAPSACAAE